MRHRGIRHGLAMCGRVSHDEAGLEHQDAFGRGKVSCGWLV
jgi:hypothetical protein